MEQKSPLSAEILAYEQSQKDQTQKEFFLLMKKTFGKDVLLPTQLPFSEDSLPWLMHEVILGKQRLDEEGEVRTTGFMFYPCSNEEFLFHTDASAEREFRVAQASDGIHIALYLIGLDQIEMDDNDRPMEITFPWA